MDTVAEIFTEEIAVPFQAASEDLVVNANQISGLETIIQEALRDQGIVTGESKSYAVGHPIHAKEIPRSPLYTDLPIRFAPQPMD